MPLSPEVLSLIQWLGGSTATGGALFLAFKKLGAVSIHFNGKSKGSTPSLQVSEKTRGCVNISEEGLRKHDELKASLSLKMSKEQHETTCRANLAEMLLTVSDTLDDKFKAQRTDIIEAMRVMMGKSRFKSAARLFESAELSG